MAGPPLARLRVELAADSASLEKGLKDAGAALQRIAVIGAAVGNVIANVALDIAGRFAAAVSSVVTGIQEVAAASRQLGVGVEELSRLRFAAESVGVSFDTLTGGMQELARKIAEAADDAGSEAARAFAAMGVAVEDAEGKARNVGEVFREVAQRFVTYAEGADKATLATAIFGSQAEQMSRLVSLGTEEIDRLGAAADRTGNTATRQAAQAMEALAQSGRETAQMFSGLATELINRVAPSLLTLMDYFRESYNSSSILKGGIEILAGAFRALSEILITANAALQAVAAGLSGVWTAVKALASGDLDGVKAALSGIGTEVAKAWNDASQAMANLNSGIASTWETTTQFAEGTRAAVPTFQSAAEATKAYADSMRQLREEMQNIVSDPMTTYDEKLAAITAAESAGAVTTEKAQAARRRAYEITAKAIESTMQSVGRALSALFPKSKAAAIGEALINTYVGITQALRSGPPPWNMIQAAAVGAMGFAQVRAITSTSENGGGGGAAAAAPVAEAPSAAPSQTLTVQGLTGSGLVSMMEVRDLAERLLAYQADGGRVVIAQ